MKNLNTPELCLAAVQQNGDALQYVPEELKMPELCLAAVQQYGGALLYVPENLKTLELCIAASQQYGCVHDCVPEELQTAVADQAGVPHYYTTAEKIAIKPGCREMGALEAFKRQYPTIAAGAVAAGGIAAALIARSILKNKRGIAG